MPDPATEIVVAARFAALPELLGRLRDRAGAAGASGACVQRMQLVVEELFANTIHHGHGGECDAPVRLAFSFRDGVCRLQYCDTAPPFDPTQAPLPEPSPDRLGGAGLPLIRQLASALDYRWTGEGNCLEIDFSV